MFPASSAYIIYTRIGYFPNCQTSFHSLTSKEKNCLIAAKQRQSSKQASEQPRMKAGQGLKAKLGWKFRWVGVTWGLLECKILRIFCFEIPALVLYVLYDRSEEQAQKGRSPQNEYQVLELHTTSKHRSRQARIWKFSSWPLALLVKIHTKKWANGIVLIDPGLVTSHLARHLPIHDPQARPYIGLYCSIL